jgi:hypothetical protein
VVHAENPSKKMARIQFFVSIVVFVNIYIIFTNHDNLKSKYNMAAKCWIHVEMVNYFLTFPYVLFVENKLCLISWDKDEALSSQRTFDEYEPAVDLTDKWEERALDKKKADLELRLTNMKKTLEAEEDFTTMTVLCYLRVN